MYSPDLGLLNFIKMKIRVLIIQTLDYSIVNQTIGIVNIIVGSDNIIHSIGHTNISRKFGFFSLRRKDCRWDLALVHRAK